MIFGHEISVPPGYEAVVNGRVEEKRPIRVGRDDQVYRVSFNPVFITVQVEAPSREGVPHKGTASVRLSLERGNLTEILRDAGMSTYRNVLNVSAKEIAERQQLEQSLRAGIQASIQGLGFFQIQNHEEAGRSLEQVVRARCQEARLVGILQDFAIVHSLTDAKVAADLLKALAARAGTTTNPDGSVHHSDAGLGQIVDYFLELQRQEQLLSIPVARAKAQAETARVETEQQLAEARARLKIIEAEQESRVKARQEELNQEDAARQQAAMERNAGIMDRTAIYEAEYRRKRSEEEIALNRQRSEEEARLTRQKLDEEFEATKKKVEIASVIDQEEEARRGRKRLDLQLELDHQRELAKIRAMEAKESMGHFVEMLTALAKMPTANYAGVQTLITGGNDDASSRDVALKMVLGLLSKAAEALDRRAGASVPMGSSPAPSGG